MNTRTALALIPCAALLLASCGGPAPDPMASQHADMMKADSAAATAVAAQETTARAIVEMFNTGNLDVIDNLMNANFVDHQQDASLTTTGIQGAKDMLALVRTAYPDFKQEILATSTTGDRTFIHIRMTGTNTGPWGEMPATGKAVDVMAVDIIRFEDGKAAEHWGYMEEMKMMQQLGLMPTDDASAKK